MKVLLIGHCREQARLVRRLLEEAAEEPFEMQCTDRLSTGLKYLAEDGVDVALLDLALPDARGLDAFAQAHTHAPGVPIVVLTDADQEATAARALKSGAQDALAKQDINGRSLLHSLRNAIERQQGEGQLALARRMQAIGQLAAGIAHEINTPVQYIGDSVHFLRDGFEDLQRLIGTYQILSRAVAAGSVQPELLEQIREAEAEADLGFLEDEVPKAFQRTLEGVSQVANIVRAMKEFSFPSRKEKAAADLNQAIRDTLTVTRNEYKYVADIVTDFGELPSVVCYVGDLNQVFLNLIVNAAHAVAPVVEKTRQRGTIRVETKHEGDTVLIAIRDTGGGIPEEIRPRVFDPFFTTKEVGRGTGQGLSIARSIVVDKHSGALWFESETGNGAAFFMRLPVAGTAVRQPQEAA